MAKKPGWGGPRKNSGRKTNAQKLLLAGFCAEWLTPELQRTKFSELVKDPDPRIRLEALKYCCDRVYGKAKQTIDSNISGELSVLSEVIAKARKRVE